MDPLSVTASIIAILQLSNKVIGYLNDVKDASKDRAKCAIEASNLHSLLTNLRYRLEDEDAGMPWFTAVRALAVENGPLDQFKEALELLQDRITGDTGRLGQLRQTLIWKFKKEELDRILGTMERLKTLVGVALQMDHFKLSQAINDSTDFIKDRLPIIQVGLDKVRNTHDLAELNDIRAWISSTDFAAQQIDVLRRRQEGTGQWFLKAHVFLEWLDKSNAGGTLFCPGIPGAGKTMMAAIASDYLVNKVRNSTTGVAWLYCSYKSRIEQTVDTLLASILKQLIQSESPGIIDILMKLHQEYIVAGTRPTADELLKTLQAVLSKYSTVHIVVDALDECSAEDGTRRRLLAHLRALQGHTDLRLMVTARHIPDIIDEFTGASILEVRAHNEDVRRFLSGQIDRLPKCVQRDAELQQTIHEKIIEAIDGMFLLARLYVDSLLDKRTKSKVLSTLEDLSGGSQTLERAYEDATRRLKSQLPGDAALAIRVISWIVYAKRSLTTTELRHALAVEPGKDHLDLNNLLDIEDIVSVCAGLVTIDTYSEVVRLVHYTTHEYFEGIREYWNPDGQLDITHTCLTYLSFAAFRYCSPPSYANSNESLGEFLGKHPFLDYAARYWGWSTVKYQSDPFDLACTVLRNDRIVSCIRQVLSGAQYKTFHHGQNWGKGLHVLAELGMKNLAERMFISFHADTDSWIVEKDHQGSTCLYVAVEHEQESMVRLFLDKGADVNAQGGKFGHVLSAAVYSRNERIVKLLIDRGAIVDRDSQDPNNAFRLAFRESSDEMAKLLLEANADTGMTGAWSQTLLCLASEEGWYDVVKILLSRAQPRSLNARDVDGWTPLAKACFNNRIDVVTLLLNEGADANICISEGLTPLHAASDQSHLEVVQLLLDNGADLNTQDQHGQTPLHSTISKGNLDVVELLLRKGADLDVLDESARRLINDASNEGRIEVIKLLLNRGCRVEFSNEDGWIPFYLAATHGHLEVVKLLLNQGTDIPTFANLDSHGRHILHITAAAGHLESCLYLIGQGIDPLARDAKGDGLLSYAASSGSLRVFEMALSLVPVSSVQTENWSPLHWACRAGNSQIIELLTQSGMRGNCVMGSQLYCNWSPIDIAMHHGHIRMLEDLSDSCKVALGPATGAGRVLETYRCYAICDGCLQNIYGPRFRCNTCLDFDYCFMCMPFLSHLHQGHEWDRLSGSRRRSDRNNAVIMP